MHHDQSSPFPMAQHIGIRSAWQRRPLSTASAWCGKGAPPPARCLARYAFSTCCCCGMIVPLRSACCKACGRRSATAAHRGARSDWFGAACTGWR
jgi:hypothetical protein